ncbi:MAG: hypothetical protein NKF39_03845 [Tropheryma whipplei]|uniref:hypothetical protein n=1 Tax=Tropheryma whipplei TaxID=2039 RepID=UPI0011D04D3E|nr:hypothetical protein [Tropheryma whipplei]MCO8183018.1 hypothetical protein [Tropheryma whipplei]
MKPAFMRLKERDQNGKCRSNMPTKMNKSDYIRESTENYIPIYGKVTYLSNTPEIYLSCIHLSVSRGQEICVWESP